MDFNLPEELQLLKDTVRKFVDRELIPLERECRPEGEDMPEQFIKPLQEKAKAIGLWLLDVPQEYGGAGLDLTSRCVIMEEVARTVAIPFRYAPIFGPEVRPVLFHCNEEQKKRFLQPVIEGKIRVCFAQTEPDAGSDPAGMKTRAVKDGDHYILNGTKRFITGAKNADYAQVIAVTDPEKGARGGVSCFMVSMKAPGVTLERLWPTMMGDTPGQIHFDNVRVAAADMIGGEGQGFAIAQKW
ncbi:MAG: acyl-CoA dehydrogenase family protein, partial [Candidatus Binatia bacterium]